MKPVAYLTAFEPFGGRVKNRSWEVAQRVHLPEEVELVQLPVEFGRLKGEIASLLATRPQGLLLLGEAPIRVVAVEAIALNRIHTEYADNAGATPREAEVVPGAPLALSADWEVGRIATALSFAGIPARPSFHAGTYACNAALYHALHLASRVAEDRESPGRKRVRGLQDSPQTAVGFLHLPRNFSGPGTDLASLAHGVEMVLGHLTGS